MHHHSSRVAYIMFRVVQPYAHLGLEVGDSLYVKFGARRFTVISQSRAVRFIPANYGSVLGADLDGCLEQIAGVFMPEPSPVGVDPF